MAYPIWGSPKPQFFDSSGSPLASGTLDIYAVGTTTAKAYYPTADDADGNTNSATAQITLDSRGEPSNELWGRDGENYKLLLKDSSGTTIYTVDDIRLPGPSRRAKGSLGASDATPSVAEGHYHQLNTDNTTITNFDDGNVGDFLVLQGPASGVTRLTNTNLQLLHDADHVMQSGDQLFMFYDGSNWRELSRTRFTKNEKKVKTADESLTSSTLANDTHLINFELVPGAYYKVTGYLSVNADAASRDLEIDFVTDNAFQASSYSWISVDSGNSLAVDQAETQALTDAVANIDIDGTGDVGIMIMGYVLTHATSVCNVDVQFANQAGAGTTTVKDGSWIKFEILG